LIAGLQSLGRSLARYLSRPDPRYKPLATSSAEQLAAALQPCDVLLIEGNTRVSTAIKYLTQSTWSHAALYLGVGPFAGRLERQHALIEADLVEGDPSCNTCYEEMLHVRHHSLFAPRDFDISPYFQIVKPSLEGKFDYRTLPWADLPASAETAQNSFGKAA